MSDPVPAAGFDAALTAGTPTVRAALAAERESVLGRRREAGGLATARGLAAAVDSLVLALVRRLAPSEKGFAVLALGGYGRGELCPGSDVDLMVVAPRRPPEVRDFAGGLAAALWDAGCTVNLTLRTPRALLQAMGRDAVLASSILDRRALCGDAAVLETVDGEVLPRFLQRRGEWFLEAKRAEARGRRAARGGTPMALEPDVKESPGGVRDVQTVRWMTVGSGNTEPDPFPPHSADENRIGSPREGESGGFGSGSVLPLTAALDVILAFRTELHLLAGRKQDLLDLATQKDLVPRLLRSDDGDPEERHLRAMAPWFRAARTAARACDAALGEGAPPPDLPGTAEDVRALLASRGPVAPTLRALHAADRLAVLLPEFAPLVALPQADPYHAWTVDEHTLRAMEALDAAMEGRGPGGARLAAEAAGLGSPLVLRLALLLHDAGKSRGSRGHAARGAEVLRGVPERFGLPPAGARTFLRIVEGHTALGEASAFAVHGEDAPVRAAAAVCGDRDGLRLLLLHTAADIGGVGHGAWTAWRAAQLLDFHDRVEAALRGAPAGPADLGAALRETLPPSRWPEIAALLARAPHRYLASVDPRTARVHLDLVRRRGRKRGAAVAAAVDRPGAVELVVAADDRPHLFADLAGSVTLAGLDILSADAHTLEGGLALDAFTVRAPVASERAVVRSLEEAAAAAPGSAGSAVRRFARRVPAGRRLPADPAVEVRRVDEGGGAAAEIRVECADRPGLLHDLARALSAAGCDLHRVRVATLGRRALDAFFVTRGGKPPATGEETASLLAAVRAAAAPPDAGA